MIARILVREDVDENDGRVGTGVLQKNFGVTAAKQVFGVAGHKELNRCFDAGYKRQAPACGVSIDGVLPFSKSPGTTGEFGL